MSGRKQPRVSKALAEAVAEQWRDRLKKDRAEMVNVPREYEATQTVPPPAPAWRSMASAPRDGGRFLGIVAPFLVVCIGYICADGEHFRAQDGRLYLVDEMIAWAPIPDWTGEVAE